MIDIWDYFDRFADAPNGIEKLRQLILDLAIRGKLVKQDPDEGDVALSLPAIANAVNALQETNKVRPKKIKDLDIEVQIEAPAQWALVNLGEICWQITDGVHHTPTYVSEGVPFLSIKNISNGYLDFSDTRFVTAEAHEEMIKRAFPQKGDVLFTRIGTLGVNVAIDTDQPFSIFVSVGLLKLVDEFASPEFMSLTLNSPLLRMQYEQIKVGGSHTNKLNLTDMPSLLIPLPPLEEQQRIVARVDELMAICDELEEKQTRRQSLHVNLNESALDKLVKSESPAEFADRWGFIGDNFELLYRHPDNIPKLRQGILDLAVRGKLVEQDPEDEPAEELLDEIYTEKKRLLDKKEIPKPKNLRPIELAEVPFVIPETWEWIRLGEIIKSITNGIYKPASFFDDKGTACLRMYNISKRRINLLNVKRLRLTNEEIEKYSLQVGDLLVNRVNSKELVGKAGVVGEFGETLVFEAMNMRVRFHDNSRSSYFSNLYLASSFAHKQIADEAKQAIGQASINQSQVSNLIFPLPPLEEQKRIVARVDELMAILDELEVKLQTSQENAAEFAESMAGTLV